MSRDSDAKRFAAAMGWAYLDNPDGGTPRMRPFFAMTPQRDSCLLPAADDRLPMHLEFVGRVAEALGDGCRLAIYDARSSPWDEASTPPARWACSFLGAVVYAPDPSHAAMLAATVSKGEPRP